MGRCIRWLLTAALPLAALPAQELRDPLLGTVLAPDGTPVAGATVEVWRAGGRGTALLDLDYKNDFRRIAVARTGADGQFAAHVPVGLPCRIVVDHVPFARYLREDCLPSEHMTIQLLEPGALAITAVLTDGSGVRCAVRIWQRLSRDEVLRGETDEQGRLSCIRLPPGELRVEISPLRGRQSMWHEVAIVAGETAQLRDEIVPGAVLRGRVLDGDGKPIAGARIGEGWTLHRAITTDADGRYELHGFGSDGFGDLHCKADGFVLQVQNTPADRDHDQTLDFRLARGHRAVGRVLDERGEPLAGAYVQAFGFDKRAAIGTHDCIGGSSLDDGTFALGGLGPDRAELLIVRRDGYGMRVLRLPPAHDGVVTIGDVALDKALVVRGTMVHSDGSPAADTAVWLHGYNDDLLRLVALGQPKPPLPDGNSGNLTDRYVGRRFVRTDEHGRFAFGDVSEGTYRVIAEDDRRFEIDASEPLVVQKGQPTPTVELTHPGPGKPTQRASTR